ncbi:cobaltochelatase subunit CobN, partial [Streptomyces sp. NPDC005568]|uniref:cobaltochelatase subunit CobN n=1 Tax=Streptomyces sp. NPDC005568 TaxID=3156887 RepID=UPI0033B85555
MHPVLAQDLARFPALLQSARDVAAREARPRIDVTVRISGFFRDAFPHVVGLLD